MLQTGQPLILQRVKIKLKLMPDGKMLREIPINKLNSIIVALLIYKPTNVMMTGYKEIIY